MLFRSASTIEEDSFQKIERRWRLGGNYDENSGFWMNLPTFRSFLRREAQMRLSVLGPRWSEAVKEESRWRLEVYRRWLRLFKNDDDHLRLKMRTNTKTLRTERSHRKQTENNRASANKDIRREKARTRR